MNTDNNVVNTWGADGRGWAHRGTGGMGEICNMANYTYVCVCVCNINTS